MPIARWLTTMGDQPTRRHGRHYRRWRRAEPLPDVPPWALVVWYPDDKHGGLVTDFDFYPSREEALAHAPDDYVWSGCCRRWAACTWRLRWKYYHRPDMTRCSSSISAL